MQPCHRHAGRLRAAAAGAWFVVGRALAAPLALGNVGSPVAVTDAKRVVLELAYFPGLGALVVFLVGLAVGRLSVRSVRDVEIRETETARPVEHHRISAGGDARSGRPRSSGPPRRPTARRGWRGMFRSGARNNELAHH